MIIFALGVDKYACEPMPTLSYTYILFRLPDRGGGNYYMLTNKSELLAINTKIIRQKAPKATYPSVIFERSHSSYIFIASNKYLRDFSRSISSILVTLS